MADRAVRQPPLGGTALPPLHDRYQGRPPIAAHRLLGDGASTALLRPNGEIDWWCVPVMDDPPILWSLLDAEGAAMRWLGCRSATAAGRIAGPVLSSRLQSPRGPIQTRDSLLRKEGCPTTLVRLVRGLDQDLDMWHEMALGGFEHPWADAQEGGFQVGNLPFRILGGELGTPDGRTPHRSGARWAHHHLTAPVGEWTALVITLDQELTYDVDVFHTQLDHRTQHSDEIVERLHLPKSFPHRAADAMRVLHACTFIETGAVVASPTTSLPEAPGYDRNFDYRYTWLRDASAGVAVAALLGWPEAAEDYLDFVVTQTDSRALPSGPMTSIRGETVSPEREVPGVAGWGGSLPVLVGNGASQQVQYDAVGLLIEAVHVYIRSGGRLKPEIWSLVKDLAQKLSRDDFQKNTGGIWEVRDPIPLVSADIGIWLALDRAVKLAHLFRPWTRTGRWKKQRDAARGRVLAALEDDGGLPQAYPDEDGSPTGARSDASALLAVFMGMFERGDERASRLVDATLDSLDISPFVYRYEPGQDDGFSGLEGAFVPCSWWAVSALAKCGRVDEALARAESLDRALPALMPEEIDPESREGLGNMPLVWAHVEAARAMYMLDDARREQRWGRSLSTLYLVGRYLQRRPRARRSTAGTPSEVGHAQGQNRQ